MSKNKRLLSILLILCLVAFSFGQVVKITFLNGIKISLLDLMVAIYIGITLPGSFKLAKLKNNRLFYPVIVFIIVCLLSLFVNLFWQPGGKIITGLAYLARFSLYFLFYLSVSQQQISQTLKSRGLLFAGLIVGIFGILQYLLYPDLRNLLYLGWDPHYYRLFSTFFDPNFTGIILVLTFFQLIFLYSSKEKLKNKVFYFLTFILLTVSIYLTRSRSAYLSLLAGINGLFIFRKFKIKYVLILLIVFFLSAKLPTPKVDVFDLFRVTSSVARIENWKQSWQLGLKSPLLGYGFGTIRFADSSLLYLWATTGILGILSFGWIFKRLIEIGWKKNRNILIIITVLLISSWFNNTLFYPHILFWLFLFLANEEEVKVRK